VLDDVKVIAKFRVKSVTNTWEDLSAYEMFPVNGKSGLEEDRRFNKYTPSGSIKIEGARKGLFEEKGFWYILFQRPNAPVPEGDNVLAAPVFEVHALTRSGGRGEGGRCVRLHPEACRDWDNKDPWAAKIWPRWMAGEIEMTIDNPPAAAWFVIDEAWRVVFVRATEGESDPLQFYTLPPAMNG
jgi:hypothetical protein